jgi:hypothetical protein
MISMDVVDDKPGCPPPPPQEALEGNGGQLSPGMVKQEEMETPTAPMRSKRSVTCPSFYNYDKV